MTKEFSIGDFKINAKSPVFIIAELSANHNGSLDNALASIKAAKRAGADAIKFQTYTADTITIDSKNDDFKIHGTIWDGKYLHDLYQEAYTPWEWHKQLFAAAAEEGLVCFSTPFDFSAVDLLDTIGAPAFKIASFEITDIPLIEYAASKGKPMILSSGIAELIDIERAIKACLRMNNDQIVILKCTSNYPAPIEEANLLMIKDFSEKFGVISGLSDHTMGIIAPIVATTLGAKIIEKHFIIDRAIGGPDASFSLDEAEFSEMVKAVRVAEKAIGVVDYSLTEKQIKGRDFSRSLYVVKNVNAGDLVTTDNVKSIRPGYGLHPMYLPEILGREFVVDVKMGERMELSLLNISN